MNRQTVKQNNYLFACDVPVAKSQRSCLQILYALDLQLWLVTDDNLKSVAVKVAFDWFPFSFFFSSELGNGKIASVQGQWRGIKGQRPALQVKKKIIIKKNQFTFNISASKEPHWQLQILQVVSFHLSDAVKRRSPNHEIE